MTEPTSQPAWSRAKRCGNNACIEVAKAGDDRYLIRDSTRPEAAPLEVTKAEWTAFVQGVRDGDFPA